MDLEKLATSAIEKEIAKTELHCHLNLNISTIHARGNL